MKTIWKTCLGLLAIALAMPATSQDKVKRDPTYSTANYKHPNKAKAAREWEPESGITFRIRKRQPQNIASYREQQRRGGLGDPAIAIPAKPSMANRNYKQQNLMVSPPPANKPEVANRAETEESVGN
ncbi:hypothetical protein [Larkinella humicola]|uniref:Uncharacterized protein n=1 Tax=Larkinella humicola TaxID=2607654 RepID=A0A5N1J8R2_9BACT|nr:hypothetical protein [Larkinella humicola]KAA9347869.1 hypothetical protein F0P93_24905 [Larkinella humicola]